MSEERCETCRFFFKEGDYENTPKVGECKRMPPTLRCNWELLMSHPPELQPGGYGIPVVYDDDWCGEYRPIGSKSDVERIEEAVNSLHASIDAVESAVCRN